jgi:hypothetical protein
MVKNSYRLAITLIAKGSINNLHRREVIEAFRQKGVEVQYLVREDYIHLLSRFPDVQYLTCRFVEEKGRLKFWRDFFRYLRFLYPGWDICNRHWFQGLLKGKEKMFKKILNRAFFLLARYRSFMNLLRWFEGKFLYNKEVEGLEHHQIDQILLLGIGTHGSDLENILNHWARKHKKSVVHLIGNYDHLTSKGYRGGPIDLLLVWGPAMRDDAIRYQGIENEKIKIIGSIRYNGVQGEIRLSREEFFRARGLDPEKKTILFAGPQGEYHYFEMFEAFEKLFQENDQYQMIYRIYPDKAVMAEAYMKPIIHYARSLPHVYVSLADPHYQTGAKHLEVPQIEQNELWHALQYSDVLVNHFSTMGLEACMFDKPVIYIRYFPQTGYTWIQPPVYYDHGLAIHNRRMLEYGVARTAYSRKELLETIKDALDHPEKFADERREVVKLELGPLDGKACQRLVEACVEAFWRGKES